MIGSDSNFDDLIARISEAIGARPYEIARVVGGYAFQTRLGYSLVIRFLHGNTSRYVKLSKIELLVLTVIAYFQPLTRMQISRMFGKLVHRDVITSLRNIGFVTTGARLPTPGAPLTYVTTEKFLVQHSMD